MKDDTRNYGGVILPENDPNQKCAVCDRIATTDNIVAMMTDGSTNAPVCDVCRPYVTAIFFVYGSIKESVASLHSTLHPKTLKFPITL